MSKSYQDTYQQAILDAKILCETYEKYGDFGEYYRKDGEENPKVMACACLQRLVSLQPVPEFDDDELETDWETNNIIESVTIDHQNLIKHHNFHKRLYTIFKSHINNYE